MKIREMDMAALRGFMEEQGQPSYRAKQVMEWLRRGAAPQQMTNLPPRLIETLEEHMGGVCMEEIHRSADGSTEKYLFQCDDGNRIEGVLMQYEHGGSLCISTQAGCRMHCAFCASGLHGLARNLRVDELIGQIDAVRERYGKEALNHVVLMGCGEPFDNYENVVRFLHLLTSEEGRNFSARNISISTCGIVEKIDAFAQEKLPCVLCISLHAPNDEIRRQILPIARRYAIDDVIAAARRYDQATGRRVVFEYTLIHGLNDSPECAKELAHRTRGMRRHINLIPLNGNIGGFSAPPESRIQGFLAELKRQKVSATIRRTLGRDIAGACGQLRLHTLQEEDR